MTDLEISKALALAIGWREEQISVWHGQVWIWVPNRAEREFDYRDWNVAGPIAARYDRFPIASFDGSWWSGSARGDTPQKAIAMAVIGAKK